MERHGKTLRDMKRHEETRGDKRDIREVRDIRDVGDI